MLLAATPAYAALTSPTNTRIDQIEAGRKCVWLTEAGEAFRCKAIDSLAPDIAHLATQIPAGSIETLLPMLTELRCILDAARSEST